MEKREQYVEQGDAELRIEAMSAEEINQVGGGHGPNRFMGASVAGARTSKMPALSGGRTIHLS